MRYLFLMAVFSLISTMIFAQSDITGTWNTGDQNTIVKIELVDDVYSGTIVSSDNQKVKIGSTLLKDVEIKKGDYRGQLYAPRKGEWYDAEITPKESNLEIKISVGFMSKTVEWTKVDREYSN